MLLSALADRRVLFVAGKGGVGKTSTAAALALARARSGQRVLLVSTDPAHNLGHAWRTELGDDPRPVPGVAGLDACEIDPAAGVERHLVGVRRSLERLLPERLHAAAARHLEAAREAPGTHESAVLERIATLLEEGLATHDAIVFDTAPSGHTLRLMALPGQLTTWTESLLANRDRSERFGAALRGLGGEDRGDRDAELRRLLEARRDRFARLRDAVLDPGLTAFVVVLTAERLPVLETAELVGRLDELGIAVGGLCVNRRSPADAGGLLAERRHAEDAHLADVRRIAAGRPVHEVGLLPREPVGAEGLAVLAEALGAAGAER